MRARLIAAARAVFARKGIEAARINEITEEADVGFGSFYNHFEGKEAIVAAVTEEAARAMADAIDHATANLDDPAEVVAVAHRTIVRRAARDPELGWLLVRLEVSHDLAFAALGPYAARDLKRGIDAGRFAVEDADVALLAAGGALLSVVRGVLQGRAGEGAAEQHAALVVRMLGLTPAQASNAARRPLPADLG
jgi:AcrR family transcriptional regulator